MDHGKKAFYPIISWVNHQKRPYNIIMIYASDFFQGLNKRVIYHYDVFKKISMGIQDGC